MSDPVRVLAAGDHFVLPSLIRDAVAAQTIGTSGFAERPCARKPEVANSAMKAKPSARCVP